MAKSNATLGGVQVTSVEEIRFRGGKTALAVKLSLPYVELLRATPQSSGGVNVEIESIDGTTQKYHASISLVSPIDAPAELGFNGLKRGDIHVGSSIRVLPGEREQE